MTKLSNSTSYLRFQQYIKNTEIHTQTHTEGMMDKEKERRKKERQNEKKRNSCHYWRLLIVLGTWEDSTSLCP